MAPRDDLGALYAKNMEHFGCGIALFQPVSAVDMQPPCVGYLDDNKRWTLIANIEWPNEDDALRKNSGHDSSFKLLERAPKKMEQVGIEWRPRTTIGVRQSIVDANGHTPTTVLPASADAHIMYKSNTDFGAVLIAQKPITLTSYNDETLFQSWLTANKSRLSSSRGAELRQHGLHIVTRTYTAPGCSINAWRNKDKEASMSMRAKASMLGELGEDLKWTERLTDKDWSHCFGKNKGEKVVLFFDGIEVPASTWWWEGVRGRFGKGDTRRNSLNRTTIKERRSSLPQSPRDVDEDLPEENEGLLSEDLWGSSTHLRRSTPRHSQRSASQSRRPSIKRNESLNKSTSTPKTSPDHLRCDQRSSTPSDQTAHISPPRRTRVRVTEPPDQRLNTASTTATTTSSNKMREVRAPDAGVKASGQSPKSALQRKAASLSLRNAS